VKTRTTAPTLAEAPQLDSAIDELGTGLRAWVHVTLSQRAKLLDRLHATVAAAAEEWADTAATSKQLEPGHPLRGEEWLSGPYATLVAIDAYRGSLGKLANGESPLAGIPTAPAPGDRRRANVFPLNPVDGMLLSGYTGEIWFTPGTTDATARHDAGLAQLHPTTAGLGWATRPEALMFVKDEGQHIVLSHYAQRCWQGRSKGAWHFYGHAHGRLPSEGRSRDVGVDLPDVDFTPRTFSELTKGMLDDLSH
jgi:hypothetical protein